MTRMNLKLFVTSIVFALIMLGAMYHFVQPGKSPLAPNTGITIPPGVQEDESDNQLSRWWRKFKGDQQTVPSNSSLTGSTAPPLPTCGRIWQKGRSSWFDGKFDDDIRPVWSRTNIKLPEDVRKWWLTLQSSDKNTDPAPVLDALFSIGVPDTDPFINRDLTRCLRCAVVGNSGNLRQSNYGGEIDGHDLVFRMNGAPIKGWEKDVGYRTTHHFMYPESASNLPDDVSFVLLNFKPLDVKWMRTALTDGSITKTWTRVKGRIQANKSKILVYNPAFFKYVHDKWTEHHGRYSSTGSLVVLFAIHVCDEVDLYGFGADKRGRWNHYYDTSHVEDQNIHHTTYEASLLAKLSSEGIVTSHRRSPRPSTQAQ